MRIAILMAGGYAVLPHTDGRKVQIQKQAEALERLGHTVVRLNPWESYDAESFDAIHIVEAGIGNIYGLYGRVEKPKLGMAPFTDTDGSRARWRYRLPAFLGSLHPRLFTQQGLYHRQARFCDLVVARNKDEQDLLIHGAGIDARKVKIVLNGIDPPHAVDIDAARKKFQIDDDFVFHVSMYCEKRKNVARLIEAVGPLGFPLIIAGTRTTAPCSGVMQAAAKYKNVRIIGLLSDTDRDALYAACRVFCLPSLYEGTGLVALEAASYGANIVITGRGGPPDYLKNFAHYVDPFSVKNIRDAVQAAWIAPRSRELQAHVINNLSWENSARSLVEAYGLAPTA